MFRQLNIHDRLALVLWGTALLAFVLGGSGLLLYHSLTLEHRARQIMEPYAQLVSVGTDAAVAFEDPIRAQEILDTLRANPQILEADILLPSGRVLASFSHTTQAIPRTLPSEPDGIYISRDRAELLQELSRGARLRLSMSLDQLSAQAHQAIWIFVAGVFVLLAATLGQLAVLRRMIVHPIASLTEATERVRTSADYKHRVPASGTDEVARLGQNFNAMMAAIQEREDDLRRLTLLQRTILDNVAYGIISTTPDGFITSFNPAAERLLGYAAGEVVGQQTPALWHDPEEIARHALQLSVQLGETIPPGFEVFTARARRDLPEENEWTFIRKDGNRVPVNLSVTALRDESGQITGFVGLTYDLTERKQAKEALQRLNETLREQVQTELSNNREKDLLLIQQSRLAAMGEMVHNIAHQWRQPLAALSVLLSNIKDEYDYQELTPEILDKSVRKGQLLLQGMSTTIDDFRNFFRPDQAPGAFDMRQSVADALFVMEAALKDNFIEVEQDMPEELTAYGYSHQFAQVVLNILANAKEAIFPRMTSGGRIRIGLRRRGNDGILTVEDNGGGIPEGILPKIFDPYFTTKDKGSGIGLYMSKMIVERNLNGRIEAANTDHGALVTITLSLYDVKAE